MRFVWTTAIKDWRRHRRDPAGVLLWIGMPILIGMLITLVAGGRGGPAPKAHVLVVDEDDSFISEFLIGAMSQDAGGGLIYAEQVDRESGEQQMDQGKASAMLVIPPGFGQALLMEEPTTLELVTNPSQRILPGIIEESLTILTDGTFYLHRLVGEDLKQIAEGPPLGASTFTDAFIGGFGIKINHLVGQLSGYLSPMLIEVETVSDAEQDEDDVPVAVLFLPGILFMSLLFMAQGISIDLWVEKDKKTLRRVVVTPQSIAAFLAGKLVSGLGLVFVVGLIALCIGYLYFEIDARTMPLAIVWTVLSGGLLILMMAVIQVHATSQQAAGVLSMAVVFPLMMVGGSFFPFEAMPDWMAAIGKLTPNGWALEQLKLILLGRAEVAPFLTALLGVVAASVLLFLWTTWRLRSKFIEG